MPITIPIEIGDVIRVGKFKNKRITVKEIGLDEYQLPTVNGKGIMKIRIEKLMPPKEPKQEIAEQVGKQSIKFIGFRKNNDGKIVEYIESIVQDLGKEFKGPIIKFGYLNQFTGLRGSKEKGWFRVNKSTIRWEKSGVIWEEGSIQLDIKQDIQENNMKNITESIDVSLPAIEKLYNGSGLNDKEAITLQTTYKKEVEDGKYPTGFNLKDVKTIMPNLLKKNLISLDNLKFAGVIRLTKSGKDFVKKINGIQESFKPNKAKLDKMIAEALHSNDTQVKIKQKDKLWWICQEESDDCLNAVGFDSKEAAEHSALTKGYNFSGQEEMNEIEPEVLTNKREKTKGVDKVEDMKLDKEKEIKLEILRIARRVIKEELNKPKDEIQKVLDFIKSQIGLKLTPDSDFSGIKMHNGKKYFNVILNQRTSESDEFNLLDRFAKKGKLLKVEPNGMNRVSIFFDKSLTENKKKVSINELEVTDPDKVKKIEEMARLSDSFDRLKAEMEKIKKQLDPLDEEITKWMDEASAAGERALETKDILITIKRKGNPNAEVAAYKERFERLYSRVNGALKKQEDEFWAATRKFKVVPTSIGVQYKKQENAMNEDNILTQGWDKIKSFFSNLYNKVIQYGKVADQGIAELHKLTGV